MDLSKIKDIINKLHAGASYVVIYKKNVQTTDGSIAYKLTSKPCRLGVRYGNTKHMRGHPVKPLPGNGKWVIDRYVYEDSNGFKLRITNGAFGKAKSTYVDASDNDVNPDIIVKSMANGFMPIVQCIKLENVIAIKRKGIEL